MRAGKKDRITEERSPLVNEEGTEEDELVDELAYMMEMRYIEDW